MAIIALAALLSVPTGVRAHGRTPFVERIAFDPGDSNRIVLTATFGVLDSRDRGATWRWVCAAAFGADPTQEDPDAVLVHGGAIVLTTFDGVVRGGADLCGFGAVDGVAREAFVVDLAADPFDPGTVWGLASSGVTADLLVRSADSGRSWSTVGLPIEELLTERVALTAADPARIYVSGFIPPAGDVTRQAFLLRSVNGGQSLTPVELPLVNGERMPHVVGVDPTNPDRVFVRMVRGVVDDRTERLLYSDDGGLTFTVVLELPSMRGFAISDDGRTVWVGSSAGAGVWVARDGATSFEQVNDLDVRCLHARGDELWLCVDQITEGFALGRSDDGGATVDEVLRLQDVEELPACPRCSSSGITCPAWVPDLRADLGTYFGGFDGGTTGVPRDAGVPPECRGDAGEASAPIGGCNCAFAGRPGASMQTAPLAMFGLVVVLRRGSRRTATATTCV